MWSDEICTSIKRQRPVPAPSLAAPHLGALVVLLDLNVQAAHAEAIAGGGAARLLNQQRQGRHLRRG